MIMEMELFALDTFAVKAVKLRKLIFGTIIVCSRVALREDF